MSAPVSPLDHGALAAAVRAGTPTLGTFIGTASPMAAEVCAAAGVDWVLLDLEHGAGGEDQVRDVVPAAGGYGMYRPLGRGDVDFAAIVGHLRGRDYGGWYVLEQDTILTEEPRGEGPVADVRESAGYLRALLAAAG